MTPTPFVHVLPGNCERALLDRFLRAEAMALRAVRSAQTRPVPPRVREFLKRHEEDEQDHLRRFETLLGARSRHEPILPRVPVQWWALAVHLYGYEALGLEFARLLTATRPDLAAILEDEELHVGFFEREVRRMLQDGGGTARGARTFARAWWRRLPRTVDRYLRDESLTPYRERLRRVILESIRGRFAAVRLLDESGPNGGPSGAGTPHRSA
ncbi:hypothetical protein [Nitrospira sp. Kam-Ns4a]